MEGNTCRLPVIIVVLIALAVYGIYDGTMDVKEVVIPVILWIVASAVSLFVLNTVIGAIIATAAMGIYFVVKLFGSDISIR